MEMKSLYAEIPGLLSVLWMKSHLSFQAAAALGYHQDDITFLRDKATECPGRCHQWPGCCIPASFGLVVLQTDRAVLAASRVQNTWPWFLRACGPYERSAWPVESECQHHLQCSCHHCLHSKCKCASFRAAIQVGQTRKQQIINIYQSLCGELITVVDLQLSDVMSEGRYHAVTAQKLAHSQTMNLLLGACFGGFHFSIYKRLNASHHHHASITMLVRNETVGKWFSGETEEAQMILLKLSARHEKELQRWHRQDEHDVAQMRLILEQNEEQHEDHKTAHLQNNDIIRSLRRHRGPCQTLNNVDKLLQRFGPQQECRAALQVEMNWHKVRLGVKSSPALYIPSQHHQACRELELSLRPRGCSTVSCRFSVCMLANLKFSFGH